MIMDEVREKQLLRQIEKDKRQLELLKEWIYSYQLGHPIADYFIANQIHTVAIYGAGEIGLLLAQELSSSEMVKVICFIDRQNLQNPFGIKSLKKYSREIAVDVVVVTVIDEFDNIQKMLKEGGAQRIISLGDIIRDA